MATLADQTDVLQRTLFVGGLDDSVTKEILSAAFIPFGEIRTVEVLKNRATGKARGYGFVEYEEAEDAAEAIFNMNESELNGKVLYVKFANKPARTSKNIPAWKDDYYFRKRGVEEELIEKIDQEEEEERLEALLQSSEAQEALQAREEARAAAEIEKKDEEKNETPVS